MTEILESMLRLSTPLLFAAMAGLFSERSGIVQLGLEGFMLVTAFTAAAVTGVSGYMTVGVFAALVVGWVFGMIFLFLSEKGRCDQIILGMGMNFLAMGMIPMISRSFFGVTGSTPSLPLHLRFLHPEIFFVLAILSVIGVHIFFSRSRWGLRIHAAGENPVALSSQGSSVFVARWIALSATSVLCSVAGIYLSLCMGSGYIRNMTAGRGYIALAAIIFGGWRPFPAMAACLFFGLCEALQIYFQSAQNTVPHQLLQAMPYITTLLILTFSFLKQRAPLALNNSQSVSN